MFIRGEIISYTRYEGKLRREKLANLAQRIFQIDTLYDTSPLPELYKERLAMQAEYDVLTTNRTTELMLCYALLCFRRELDSKNMVTRPASY